MSAWTKPLRGIPLKEQNGGEGQMSKGVMVIYDHWHRGGHQMSYTLETLSRSC